MIDFTKKMLPIGIEDFRKMQTKNFYIDRNRYAEALKDEGCHTILKYGIACYKKECKVLMKKEELGES